MSIREMLLGGPGSGLPPFRMLLAPGWVAERPSGEGSLATSPEIGARLKASHRPDADAQLAPLLRRADERLRALRAFLTLRQAQEVDGFFAPMTITMTEHAATEGTLDAQVSALVAKHGAEPLRGDLGMLRWVTDGSHDLAGGRVRTRTVSYLTPVPGTAHVSAVLVAATIVAPDDAPDDHPLLVGSVEIADAMLATFEWEAAS